jgi:hypothetical protein
VGNLEVKNVPDGLHHKIRAAARRRAGGAALVTADGPLARASGLDVVVHNVRLG